jgi:hypothetical protein
MPPSPSSERGLERDPSGRFIKSDAAPVKLSDDKTKTAESSPDKKAAEKSDKPPKEYPAVSAFAEDFITGNRSNKPLKSEENTQGDDVSTEKEKAKLPERKADDKPKEPAPTKKAVIKPTAPAPLTAADIAKAAAEGVASAMKTSSPKEEKKDSSPADPDADVPDEEKKRFAVLRFMEKQDPSKFKGIADKYKSQLKTLADYAAKWRKDHPGEEFDDEAEEHAEFFEKNDMDLPWDADDFTDAKAEMIAEKKVAEATAETNKKLSIIEREKKALEAKPLIEQHQVVAAREYWKRVGGEFDGIVLENGQIDQVKIKELMEKNPDYLKVTVDSAKRLDALVETAYLLKKGLVDFDPKKPAHEYLSQFAAYKEQELMSRPADQQLDAEGRQFKPSTQYYNIPVEERTRSYWTFNETDLAALLASDESRKMQAFITAEEEKHNRWAKARGLEPKESVLKEKAKEKLDKDDVKQPIEELAGGTDEGDESASPSSGASPKSATILNSGKKQPATGVAAFASGLLE